jgi:hypothetical protein
MRKREQFNRKIGERAEQPTNKIKMSDIYTKRCSISFVFQDMEIAATMR